ncbi:MAG: hypothetical protein ACO3FI_04210 [Cyclobacteriaceae bacterium]
MKVIAREIFWLIVALILAAPVAWLFSYLLGLEPAGQIMTKEEEAFQMEFFIIGYVIGIVCTYVMRLVIWVIKKLVIVLES